MTDKTEGTGESGEIERCPKCNALNRFDTLGGWCEHPWHDEPEAGAIPVEAESSITRNIARSQRLGEQAQEAGERVVGGLRGSTPVEDEERAPAGLRFTERALWDISGPGVRVVLARLARTRSALTQAREEAARLDELFEHWSKQAVEFKLERDEARSEADHLRQQVGELREAATDLLAAITAGEVRRTTNPTYQPQIPVFVVEHLESLLARSTPEIPDVEETTRA